MRVMKLKLLPSCTQQPRTLSFRSKTTTFKDDDILRTINSVYVEPEGELVETPESWFTNSSESTSTTTEFDESSIESYLEEIIRGAQQSVDQRLFFEPRGDKDSPKLHKSQDVRNFIPDVSYDHPKFYTESQRKKPRPRPRHRQRHRHRLFPSPPPRLPPPPALGSEMIAVDSENPYKDFKRSMEEMVESHEMRYDLEALEELLGWYLKANDESNHGYIVSSFVDLLAGIFANGKYEISKSSCHSSVPSSLSSSASVSPQLFEEFQIT